MKRRSVFLVAVAVLFGAAAFFASNPISADPITVDGPFHFRDNRSANSVGLGPGDFLTFGAHEVIPNGDDGTAGKATQGSTQENLIFYHYCANPNLFARSHRYAPNLTGQWDLAFTNGQDTASAVTPAVDNAPVLPFASSVAISGSGLTPTFSWTFPDGFTPDGVRIQIWDLETPVANLVDFIHGQNFQGNPGSFTVPSTFSCGEPLKPGHRYSLEISPALTRGVPLGNNSTILSRSRSFFDFVPLPPDAPPNVFLPVVTPGPIPVYSFHTTVVGGQAIFIDPPVAIGYVYAIGTGNPNFASVTLPTGIGDNMFDLYLFNGMDFFFKAHLAGGNTYTFDPGGVDRFRILGIEPSAGLDPQNPTAFITGLTFVGSGEFTGTMTPNLDFSLTLYDDFSGTYINKEKWMQAEWVIEIDPGNHKLLLKQASPSPIAIDSYPYNDSNSLNFSDPNSVNSIQADVTILENNITNQAYTRARVAGRWYNDGTTGGGRTGDIHAEMSLRGGPTGLFARWAVSRFTNAEGTTSSNLGQGDFTTPINLGATYTLYISYDVATNQFTFRIGTEEKTFGPGGLPTRVGNANSPSKNLLTRVQVDNSNSSCYISATLDNVYKNGVLYDDFSSPLINKDNWSSYEIVRKVSEGKLWSELRSVDQNSRNSLEFKNPEQINEVQAKVTPLDFKNPDGALTRARLGGHFYNDTGDPNSGYLGDVWAEVSIGGSGTDPSANWQVVRYTNAEGTSTTTLGEGQFPVSVNFGETYDLFLGWDGSTFTFKCNDSVANYTPTTSKFSPNNKRKDLATRVQFSGPDLAFEASISATFDDVMTNDIFSDVPIDYWAYDYIIAIYNDGITTGCAQDDPNTPENERRYCPENNVSRDQMAAFIVRAKEGEPASDYCSTGSSFSDVDSNYWACKYIKRLYELGITTGCAQNPLRYCPDTLVSRDQMATFIVRAKEGDPADNYCASGSPFSDVDPNHWACKYIKRLYELGITTGCAQNPLRYCPNDIVTRAQMAAFLARAFLGME